ncbi:ethylbenzene dehydrogenase-related protein [Terasakiella sp. A23]|uniref:NapC/NirT family cytochrome c n=1 Tax=Terasakiella sp. FCG-A23 TaxID=3080561 RepID=UPI002955AF25|nr:NapC/NirT family cytochrome c [Terasakiella sp. A23]MDV7341277.1 ethylbenzene dehydrogenase-related protein [Terasakiella sp. A23]
MAEGSFFSRLSKLKIMGVSIFAAAVIFIGGIIFWGGFNTAMEATNQMEFCVSCHEMDQLVYPEYQETIHYQNRTGVQATCPDCHVPRPWIYKMIRKIQASKEVWGWLMGSYDTMEEFESQRLTMAKSVWKAMKETDSRECRNCHSWDAMTDKKQKRRAWKQHQTAKQDGMTCIDCHKGIAHRNVHQLIEDEETFYDGKPNPARLEVLDPRKEKIRKEKEAAQKAAAEAEAKKKAAEEAAAKAKAAMEAAKNAPAAAGGAGGAQAVAWDGIQGSDITLMYPGQASLEWVFRGKDHGGARALRKTGDRCAECHKGEEDAMGGKIVGGDKAETTPIPGKAPFIKMNVKAANDGSNLYMRYEWKSNPHTPAPFADGGKMDKENAFKLAMMINSGKSEIGEQAGCWATCHHDSRYMPNHPEKVEGDLATRLDTANGVTKYLNETRTEFEYKGRRGKKQGAWDKLKPQEEIDALLKDGLFLDLLRYNSGSKKSEDGHVLEKRVMSGGQGVNFVHEEKDGVNVVYMTRKLVSDKPGDVSLETGKLYKVGFAVHDDHTNARFHHVSIDWYLGLDNAEADINAVTVGAPSGGAAPAAGATSSAAAAPAASGGSVNWAAITGKKVPFFYPGQASIEWIFRGKDHGGARAVSKVGDRCTECHGNEQPDMGAKIVGGEKAETSPIPGKAAAIDAEIKAAHDGKNVYFQVSWKDTGGHNPVPFADGGKMDKENQVKLAMMVAPTKEDFIGSQAGCWATCHHDNRYMPNHPEGQDVTKYLNESRTEFEYKGRRGKKQGAWDKLKPQAEIDALLKDGLFLDLMRFKSGNGGQFENGYVLDKRVMGEGIEVTGSGELKDGVWTVTLQRPLASDKAGDISFEPGKEYVVGFAIHDDYTNARFHHVSLELKMQLDNPEAEINAAMQ